ncbi:MetS family NSS transporter small subunit [Methanocaldococcus jannaschii]|nr:MetS family NSS transporter small subunit [Methanocaldococcus jannaschii]
MNLGAIAMFIFGAVILWGGAIYFLWRSIRSKNNRDDENSES